MVFVVVVVGDGVVVLALVPFVVSSSVGPSVISPDLVSHTASAPLPSHLPLGSSCALLCDTWLSFGCSSLSLLLLGAIAPQCFFQALRSCANFSSSSNELVGGASAQRLPGRLISYWARTASLISRSLPSCVFSVRRICPSHWCRRFRIAVTISKVRFLSLT